MNVINPVYSYKMLSFYNDLINKCKTTKVKKISITTKHQNFNLNSTLYAERDENTQQLMHFYKTKFGLYKNNSYANKRIKDNMYSVLNYVKYYEIYNKEVEIKKRPKMLFYKRFNKLFFRSGRAVLLGKMNLKKTLIQKYISKKITHLIKKPNLAQLDIKTIKLFLVKCGLFYSFRDASNYINNVGMQLNNKFTYNPETIVSVGDVFSTV